MKNFYLAIKQANHRRQFFLFLATGLFLLCLWPWAVGAEMIDSVASTTMTVPEAVIATSTPDLLPPIAIIGEDPTLSLLDEAIGATSSPIMVSSGDNQATTTATSTLSQNSDNTGDLSQDKLVVLQQISTTLANIQTILAISGELAFSTSGSDGLPSDPNQDAGFTTLPADEPTAGGLSLSEEEELTTIPIAPTDHLIASSSEQTFNTLDHPTDHSLAVSQEMSFRTESIEPEPVISHEYHFNTRVPNIPVVSISAEYNFKTKPILPTSTPAISHELSFITLQATTSTTTLTVSGEYDFTTLIPPGTTTPAVSQEFSFTTTKPTTTPPAISEENNFETSPIIPPFPPVVISDEVVVITITPTSTPPIPPTPPGGGGGSIGGGGGLITPASSTPSCEPYLKKFIKYGRVNDRNEVIKLQLFLRLFEGDDYVPTSGVYDQNTFRAVEAFQQKYGRDVLRPWGITDSTGYVYITTTLAVNNIFCGLDTANGLDLRKKLYQEYESLTGQSFIPISTTTTTTAVKIIKPNSLLAAVGALLAFIEANLCWLLNLLLLAIILFLLWLLWNDRDDNPPPEKPGYSVLPPDKEKTTGSSQDFLNLSAGKDSSSAEKVIYLGSALADQSEQLTAPVLAKKSAEEGSDQPKIESLPGLGELGSVKSNEGKNIQLSEDEPVEEIINPFQDKLLDDSEKIDDEFIFPFGNEESDWNEENEE